jgi:GNAT superfamily N-acetyltransferase
VAIITPVVPVLSRDFVRYCLQTLAAQGFRQVRTGALFPLEQAAFLAVGFQVHESLRLLTMELTSCPPPVPPGLRVTRVARYRRREILEVDAAAFEPCWRLDGHGLAEALRATPVARLRAARDRHRQVVGYAIVGRAGSRGFVQRLAVHPGHQGGGTGRRLLLEGIHWLRDRGVRWVAVNTQPSNQRALSLYRRVGFREEAVGLSVLSAALP